jgi:ElaB/YqjD/DUF883 family membrane-anchored ribosome-binding protein
MARSIPEIRSDIDNTKEHISETMHELQESFGEIRTNLFQKKEQVEHRVKSIENRAQNIRHFSENIKDFPVSQVQKRPLTTLLATVGIGIFATRTLLPVLSKYAPTLKSIFRTLVVSTLVRSMPVFRSGVTRVKTQATEASHELQEHLQEAGSELKHKAEEAGRAVSHSTEALTHRVRETDMTEVKDQVNRAITYSTTQVDKYPIPTLLLSLSIGFLGSRIITAAIRPILGPVVKLGLLSLLSREVLESRE